jgi:hypothetical protein
MTKKTETGKEAQREKSLPKEYKRESQRAKREKKKGRQEKGEEEGCMERKVHTGNKWWKKMK